MASTSSTNSQIPTNDSRPKEQSKIKRVAVVGSGAAGSSCAYALSKHPDMFKVTVFDKEQVAGGMATSLDIDADK